MQLRIAPADPAADPYPYNATATNLNRYGALLSSSRELKLTSHVLLTNPHGQRALARVIAEIRRQNATRHYGVEFLDDSAGATFWGITF
jgi:hypothetical protein